MSLFLDRGRCSCERGAAKFLSGPKPVQLERSGFFPANGEFIDCSCHKDLQVAAKQALVELISKRLLGKLLQSSRNQGEDLNMEVDSQISRRTDERIDQPERVTRPAPTARGINKVEYFKAEERTISSSCNFTSVTMMARYATPASRATRAASQPPSPAPQERRCRHDDSDYLLRRLQAWAAAPTSQHSP